MRVIIADDVLLTRAGIKAVLTDVGCEVVAEARDGAEALAAVQKHAPDVAIIDIRMPPTHTDEGLVVTSQILASGGTAVLVLSQYVDTSFATRLIGQYPERTGYLLKERVLDGIVLLDALTRVSLGECVIDPTIVARMMHRQRRLDPIAQLTDRERDVLTHVAEGHSNRAIADLLYIAERTVEAHTTQIFQKLGLEEGVTTNRRVAAVLTYLQSLT